ncbi:MAG: hypothetical protein R3C56_13645 [Pirellulaceae bacterium]
MDYPEDTLSGTSLGLNLLNRVAFARKQKAARVTWHTHEHIELLLAADSATVYEFSDGQTVDFTGDTIWWSHQAWHTVACKTFVVRLQSWG